MERGSEGIEPACECSGDSLLSGLMCGEWRLPRRAIFPRWYSERSRRTAHKYCAIYHWPDTNKASTGPNILIDGRIGKLVLISLCFGFTADCLLGVQYCAIQCSAAQLPYYCENTDLENMMIREFHIIVPELWMIMSSASHFL